MGEPAIVNNDRVLVSEVDRGQVAGKDLLNLYVIGASAVHVGGLGGVIEQRVKLRVGIMAAVGASGREAQRRKDVTEDALFRMGLRRFKARYWMMVPGAS